MTSSGSVVPQLKENCIGENLYTNMENSRAQLLIEQFYSISRFPPTSLQYTIVFHCGQIVLTERKNQLTCKVV